jgi:hypothetical protein
MKRFTAPLIVLAIASTMMAQGTTKKAPVTPTPVASVEKSPGAKGALKGGKAKGKQKKGGKVKEASTK